MANIMVETEYIKGTTKRKIQFVLLIFLVMGGYLLAKFVWLTDLENVDTRLLTMDEQKEHINNILNRGIVVGSFLLPLYVYASILFYRFGRRIHKNEQYPPPSAEMPFTTKVIRGKKACYQAYVFYVVSIVLFLQGSVTLGFSIYHASSMRELVNAI